MRKMASLKRIAEIKPIPDADKICAYRVDGWWCVDNVGKYNVGDLVVYCEIDSWIPHVVAPFLSKTKEPREYNGIKGERLRTVKLRGQVSQGLLLPVQLPADGSFKEQWGEGVDVSEFLGIEKWEPPLDPQVAAVSKGSFPGLIPKTDQERIQNLTRELPQWLEKTWEVTEKLDGSSMTCYMIDRQFGVCSRNLDLKFDPNNSFWKTAIKYNIEQKLRDGNIDNIAIQGELIGPGIQGNKYNLTDHTFNVFDIYDIKDGYYSPVKRVEFCENHHLMSCPVITESYILTDVSIDILLKNAEGKSLLNLNTEREGLVFKQHDDPSISFKVISNKFLLKEKE